MARAGEGELRVRLGLAGAFPVLQNEMADVVHPRRQGELRARRGPAGRGSDTSDLLQVGAEENAHPALVGMGDPLSEGRLVESWPAFSKPLGEGSKRPGVHGHADQIGSQKERQLAQGVARPELLLVEDHDARAVVSLELGLDVLPQARPADLRQQHGPGAPATIVERGEHDLVAEVVGEAAHLLDHLRQARAAAAPRERLLPPFLEGGTLGEPPLEERVSLAESRAVVREARVDEGRVGHEGEKAALVP